MHNLPPAGAGDRLVRLRHLQFFGDRQLLVQPAAAMALPVTSPGFTDTQSALQSGLNSTGSGGTVTLAQKALVTLTSTLNVPAGVTLTTYGNPAYPTITTVNVDASVSSGWASGTIQPYTD